MSFGSIWSMTHSPSGVAWSPFGCLPGVFHKMRGSTFEAIVPPGNVQRPFCHDHAVETSMIALIWPGTRSKATGSTDDGRAVPSSQIKNRPLKSAADDQLLDLADVELAEPTSHNHAPRRMI